MEEFVRMIGVFGVLVGSCLYGAFSAMYGNPDWKPKPPSGGRRVQTVKVEVKSEV